MMPGKHALYEQVMLDHNRKPRNFREMADATFEVDGLNPLCGDRFKIYVKMDGDVIAEVSFTGTGCAISKSSASLMTEIAKGKTKQDVEALFARFNTMITSDPAAPVNEKELGDLITFSSVREYPLRTKCATFCWQAMLAPLNGASDPPTRM